MAKAAAAAAWCLVVLAALVAAEADPGHHHGGTPYYKRPYYKRPSFYSQRRPYGGVNPGAVHSEAVSGHSSFDHASVGHLGGQPDIHTSVGHDSHDAIGHASTGPVLVDTVDLRSQPRHTNDDLYPGLREGYSFYTYKPTAGHDGCSDWCYSSGASQYYCCHEAHH